MLRPRVIPCLLIRNGGLVKTVGFDRGKYVGDPINAVKIFNEKEVDEIVVLDIDASAQGREPDYSMIKNLAAECRMPLCYGGGVKSVEQFERIVSLGVEKVAASTAFLDTPTLVSDAARVVGSQSVVVIIDVKRVSTGKYEIRRNNGTTRTKIDPAQFANEMQDRGAGEIVVNSIDNDGAMKGYDLELAKMIRRSISVPLSVLGGAGSLRDIQSLIKELGVVGAAAGSLFVFKGPFRAVLINYPSRADKESLFESVQTKIIG